MNDFILNHLQILKDNNFLYPEIELRALLHKSSKDKKEIILSNFNIDQINFRIFKIAFKKRLKKEPIAKIFNEKEFWSNNFFVNKDVLDPRPETEILLETINKYFIDKKLNLKIADLGTGSGCIGISLALEYRNSKITAVDISKKAINIAIKNSKKFNIFDQMNFLNCDWMSVYEKFDIIVSNPPYLSNKEYNNLGEEIKNYEPKIAFIGGNDGLSCFRQLACKFPKISHSNTLCFVEIGYNQTQKCIKIFEDFGMNCIDIIHDYQNYERILVLKKI